ncbi:MAG: efflux RND transporter periplasmic adaptor subunit [Chitinispirillales bacterium]|jgi:RND family efflux transporter MFP subunit|nr:efflux RND transporter periplasmic adaptor subunit [Chitinispirillales bacterium]
MGGKIYYFIGGDYEFQVKIMKKYFFILFFFLSLYLCACNKTKQDKVIEKEPFPVNAVIVKNILIQKDIAASVLLQGIKKTTIVSQAAGTISSVTAKLGDTVHYGNILIETENSIQTANLKQAAGAVEESELNFSASQRLFNSNSISKAEYIRSKNNLLAAQTVLASAQKSFKDTKITAPFDGIITNINDIVQTGNTISIGQPLLSIADISKLKANISLGEKEIGQIKKGAAAFVKIPSINAELKGIISAVPAGSDPSTGAFTAEVVFENPQYFVKDGMSGIVSAEIGSPLKCIAIPATAALNNRSVFIVRNGKAFNAAIEYEHISQGRILIKKGVSQNDTVIVSGITQISQNDTLSINIIE